MRRLALLTVAVAISGCASTPKTGADSDWGRGLVEAEVTRDAGHPAVRAALSAKAPEARKAALWALSRIEEIGTATLAAPLLSDPSPTVAHAAAFALGQIGDDAARAALRAALPKTSAPKAALRALARCGTASAAADISAFVSHADPGVRAVAALSLGLLKKRVPEVDARYEAGLVPLLADLSPEVRYGATYALARFPGPEAAVALVVALADKDPEVRMWAAVGLGKSGANPSVLDAVMRDPDWRVRSAAARALGDMAAASPMEAPRALGRLDALASQAFARLSTGDWLSGGRALHVLNAAIAGAEKAGPAGRKVLERLEQATWETEDLPASASQDLARVQCAAAVALDRLDGVAKRIETCGKGTFSEWRRAQHWMNLVAKEKGDAAVPEIAPFTRNPDPRLRAAAVLALGEIRTPDSTAVLLGLLTSNDPAVVSGAFELLASSERESLRPPAIAETLLDALERLLAQPDDSLIVGPIDALAGLGDEARPLLGRLAALRSDPRPAVRRRAAKVRAALTGRPVPYGPTPKGARTAAPAPYPRPAELVLETARGTVVLRLEGGRAPRYTGALVGLARAGYYDGLTIHRVVSTFVTQGGCPRGDGWGGPGYTVPAETSDAPFERGAIGIATNGRDTGGSQFFVMHARHPHLEGRYPWIGRVVDGIDVADALQPDDVILRATVR